MKLYLWLCLIVALLTFSSVLSEPAYNGNTPGCGGGRCHAYQSGIVSAEFIGDNQIQVSVAGTSSNIGAELIDAANKVVDAIESTKSNPCILTAPGPGDYIINAGYAGPLEYGSTSIKALPVELSTFEAKIINGNVRLFWQTQSESNNYGFYIQSRHQHETTWRCIGFVSGHGTTMEPQEYSFIDESDRINGMSFYRLQQIDTTGECHFSEEIAVSVDGLSTLSLRNYPNPFNAVTTIQFESRHYSYTRLTIYNSHGSLVSTLLDGPLDAGKHSIAWHTTTLPSGIYMIVLESAAQRFVQKAILAR